MRNMPVQKSQRCQWSMEMRVREFESQQQHCRKHATELHLSLLLLIMMKQFMLKIQTLGFFYL